MSDWRDASGRCRTRGRSTVRWLPTGVFVGTLARSAGDIQRRFVDAA
jgi:hypothetical protein